MKSMPLYFKSKFVHVIVSMLVYCIKLVAHSAQILSRLMDQAIKYIFDHRSESHFTFSSLATLVHDLYVHSSPEVCMGASRFRLIVREIYEDKDDPWTLQRKSETRCNQNIYDFLSRFLPRSPFTLKEFPFRKNTEQTLARGRERASRDKVRSFVPLGKKLMLLSKTKK